MREVRARVRRVPGRIVVEHVVDEDGVHLGQRVPVVRVGEDVPVPGPVALDRLGVGAELLSGRVGDHRVLEGDVGDRVVLPVVADAVDDVPGRELQRGVIDDDVVRAVEAERVVLGAGGVAAGADADVADDDVRLAGERDLAALEPDPVAGRRLARDGEVALARHGGDELNVAADVEHDDPVRGAHGVAEGARSGVVQVGDVIDGAGPAARHVLAKPLRARKRQRRPSRLPPVPVVPPVARRSAVPDSRHPWRRRCRLPPVPLLPGRASPAAPPAPGLSGRARAAPRRAAPAGVALPPVPVSRPSPCSRPCRRCRLSRRSRRWPSCRRLPGLPPVPAPWPPVDPEVPAPPLPD